MRVKEKTKIMQSEHWIVVIGASAGGTQALLGLVKQLPAELNAAVLVVQHIPAHTPSNLAQVLQHHTDFKVVNATNGERIRPGTIYCAVADHHLLVEGEEIVVTKGPKENRFRPSVDALFRSAAYHYRRRVIGVVLSGALNDGTSGMWAIKRMGGTSMIQLRSEARFDSMPASVAKYTDIDYELPAAELAGPIHSITQRTPGMHKSDHTPNLETERFLRAEINIARGANALENGVLDHGVFSPLTCPDCHGALTEYKEGNLRRYRCHTGHGHTSETLLTGINENVEKSMWEVMRGLEESQLLLNHMAEVHTQSGKPGLAREYQNRAGHLAKSAQIVKAAILNQHPATGQSDGQGVNAK